jgi:hypothetical protein
MDSATVNPGDRLAHVLRTMQLGVLPPTAADVPAEPAAPAPEVEATIPSPTLSSVDPNELEEALKQLAIADLEAAAAPEENSSSGSTSEGSSESDEAALVAEPIPYTPYPNLFVIGDAADAFGAIPAGHTAYYQVYYSVKRSVCIMLTAVM